ncbi:hypothetical protein Taro_029777, partial [Colocasia esculenta]|nr:hypothetical protein [Colocasia esculenta]
KYLYFGDIYVNSRSISPTTPALRRLGARQRKSRASGERRSPELQASRRPSKRGLPPAPPPRITFSLLEGEPGMDGSSERARRGEHMEAAEETAGGDVEMEDAGRESGGHHRSKDRNRKERREERDRGSRREREKEESDRKDRRKVEDREEKERARDKAREKGHERDGKQKDRDREREVDREKERSYDRDHERGKERGRDRGREHDKERDAEREQAAEREYDRAKEREKDRDRERSKLRERDHEKELDKEPDRERGREKDHERGKYRDREREERDRNKDREREKEKVKDREKETERAEREKGKEKVRDREKEKGSVNDRDKSRTRERERDREGEDDETPNVEGASNGTLQLSTSEIGERITKMKEVRLKKKSDGASEILSWINKSRKLDEKKITEKEKASRLMKALEEQDNIHDESEEEEASEHIGKHLAGVKILHGLDKVLEGGAVVLTLKDQNILADGDVNEDVDMLENVEIGEQKRRDEAYKAAKRRTGVYDDKFSEGADSQRTILPQYDEPAEEEGLTLDEKGRIAGEAEKKLEELRRRIQGRSITKNFEDLTSSGKFSSDYYTPEEMLQFKKPKRKKSLRKKEKLDLDALEAEAKSTGLGIGDLGSRGDQTRLSARQEQEKAEAQARKDAYESALAKAEEASKSFQQQETLMMKAEEDDSPVFGEDYEDLQRALEQARKLALSRQDEVGSSGPQAIALEVKSKNVDPDSAPGEPQENKVVITEMEEFVLGLQFSEDTHRPETEDVFMDEEAAPKVVVGDAKDEGHEAGGWSELKEATDEELSANEEKEDVVPDETIHEVVVGKGLSGALKLLQERGTLKETVEWGGRTMDKKKSKLVGILDNQGAKEIRIERTDEFGRIMTPKEAFRMLSHKFHGKGPGKSKQEKRMKQYQEELKLKQMKASDTPSMSVERMREAQARLKTPYLVLSGHVKPGQTSDPRSGFATVEKDNLGSLTPMLGDRKVEHFLGIKRKTDSSGMPPPPPKKPKS